MLPKSPGLIVELSKPVTIDKPEGVDGEFVATEMVPVPAITPDPRVIVTAFIVLSDLQNVVVWLAEYLIVAVGRLLYYYLCRSLVGTAVVCSYRIGHCISARCARCQVGLSGSCTHKYRVRPIDENVPATPPPL